MKRWVAVVLVGGLLGMAGAARAYTLDWLGSKLGNGPTLPDGGGDPFVYDIDATQAMPGGLVLSSMESEIQAAFATWSSTGCAYIGARLGTGITDPSQLGTHSDTKSVMGTFINASTDPRYDEELGGGVAVGVALSYTVDGVIEGCDVEYNDVDYSYADNGAAADIDFPSVAQHETGHCFGLAHAPEDLNSVMYPHISPGEERRTPDARDIDNLCQLYPATGALGSPCAGNSCGNGLFCIANTVQGGNFCSHACDLNLTAPGATGGCEVGFGCKATTAIAGSSGACFPGPGDQAQVGGPCALDTDCAGTAAVCVTSAGNLSYPGGYCSEACGGNACPDGNVCVQIGVDAQGQPQSYCLNECSSVTGGCRAGYACNPITADGAGYCYPACASDADCGGAACLCTGVCTLVGSPTSSIGSPCAANADCPTGAFCIPATLPGGMASGWSGGYCAESCGGTNACITCPSDSACVVDGEEGQAYCLQLCSANGGCRSGYGCGSALTPGGEAEVCQPGLGSACVSDNSCPVGEVCSGGTCVEPGSDGGCHGPLCPSTDAGSGVTDLGSDGGVTAPPPPLKGGCGCGDQGLEPMLWFLVAAALRRRTR